MQMLACQKHVESRSSKELISIPSHFHSGPGFAGMKCSGHLPVTENHSHLQSLQ